MSLETSSSEGMPLETSSEGILLEIKGIFRSLCLYIDMKNIVIFFSKASAENFSMADDNIMKRYSMAEIIGFLTGNEPCPDFSDSSDSEAVGECCEGSEGTNSGMESENSNELGDGSMEDDVMEVSRGEANIEDSVRQTVEGSSNETDAETETESEDATENSNSSIEEFEII